MDIISKEHVISVIDKAEAELRDCFRRLVLLKNMDASIQKIMDFQPKLAFCLHDLMGFYHRLCQEEKQIIKRKTSFNDEQFRNHMATNSEYKKAITEVINIGKHLGDSFVWFFYRDNLEELEKHLKHKTTGLFVSGIGALGELEFIKNSPTLNEYVVLYHSMTSMLRIGDISLWKPGTGIIGIGEIKTKEKSGNCICVNVFITSTTPITPNIDKSYSFEFQANSIPNKDKSRLQRQLKTQSNALKKEDKIGSKELYSDYNFDLLNGLDAEESSMNVSQDSTLIVFGHNLAREKLSDILTNENKEITIPNSHYDKMKDFFIGGVANSVPIVRCFDCKVSNGRIPVFWWDSDIEIIEKILFKELLVTIAFNPARFFNYFIAKGYSTVTNKKGEIIALDKRDGNKGQVFNALPMMFDLITHSFMKCDSVIEIVNAFLIEIENMEVEPNINVLVNMKIQNSGQYKYMESEESP